eukprot:EG_transcript_40342
MDFEDVQQIAKELRCVICMDLFQDPVVTPCNHSFCRPCIEQHLRNSSSCPLCKMHVIKRGLIAIPVVANIIGVYQRMVGEDCLSQLSQRARARQLPIQLPPSPAAPPSMALFASPTSFSST